MFSPDLSTIAQLMYADETRLDFARIVSDLDTVLSRLNGERTRIAWDCDDLVTFETPDTRILLAWNEASCPRAGGCLTISVGPCTADVERPPLRSHDVLCSQLTECIERRFAPAVILWCQVEGPVDAEVVDEMVVQMPALSSILPSVESILEDLSRTDLTKTTEERPIRRTRAAQAIPRPMVTQAPALPLPQPLPLPLPLPVIANDVPDLPRPRNEDLVRLREALYPVDEDVPYSTQMRLAVHCLNATLVLVWAPLGAAVMTYSVLRGENMRLSGRMMAVAGTLFALAHSPVGQTMAVMAQGLG